MWIYSNSVTKALWKNFNHVGLSVKDTVCSPEFDITAFQ